MLRSILAGLFILLLGAGAITAQIFCEDCGSGGGGDPTNYYYVDKNCATSGTGDIITCGATGPKKTIGEAVGSGTIMQPGNVIFVRGGTYNEYVRIGERNGASGNPITLRRYAAETVILDGTGNTAVPQDRAGIFIEDSTWIVVDGFTVRDWHDAVAGGVDGIAVQTLQGPTASNIVLRNITAYNNHTGILVEEAAYVTVEYSLAYANFFHGIYSEDSDWVTFRKSVARDNTDPGENDGFHVGDSRDVTIEDCIAYGNYEQGFDIGGHCVNGNCSANASSQRVSVNRVAFWGNGGAQARGGLKVGGYKDDTITVTNSVGFNNSGFCNFCILGGKDVVLNHVTSYGASRGFQVSNCTECVSGYQTGTVIRNSVTFDLLDPLTVSDSNSGIALDYNGYWVSTDDSDSIEYRSLGPWWLSGFGDYVTTTGQDENSLTGNPLFVNTGDPDGADNLWFTADDGLLLQSGSPFRAEASDGKDMGYYPLP